MITRLIQPTIPRQRQATALYRFWGSDGALLYVGISNHPDLRWAQHAADKPWWGQVTRKEVVGWYSTRGKAERAEMLAIRSERPRYNVIHNERNPHRVAYRKHAAGIGRRSRRLLRKRAMWPVLPLGILAVLLVALPAALAPLVGVILSAFTAFLVTAKMYWVPVWKQAWTKMRI